MCYSKLALNKDINPFFSIFYGLLEKCSRHLVHVMLRSQSRIRPRLVTSDLIREIPPHQPCHLNMSSLCDSNDLIILHNFASALVSRDLF